LTVVVSHTRDLVDQTGDVLLGFVLELRELPGESAASPPSRILCGGVVGHAVTIGIAV
jgi:hypothetical protein